MGWSGVALRQGSQASTDFYKGSTHGSTNGSTKLLLQLLPIKSLIELVVWSFQSLGRPRLCRRAIGDRWQRWASPAVPQQLKRRSKQDRWCAYMLGGLDRVCSGPSRALIGACKSDIGGLDWWFAPGALVGHRLHCRATIGAGLCRRAPIGPAGKASS